MLKSDRDIFLTDLATREYHTIMQLQEYKKIVKQTTQHNMADAKKHDKHFKKIDQLFPIKIGEKK